MRYKLQFQAINDTPWLQGSLDVWHYTCTYMCMTRAGRRQGEALSFHRHLNQMYQLPLALVGRKHKRGRDVEEDVAFHLGLPFIHCPMGNTEFSFKKTTPEEIPHRLCGIWLCLEV